MENPSKFLGPTGLIRKDEFVRIIAQSLYSLGYHNSASLLESESGVSYKSQEFRSLEPHVLNGDWDGSATVLYSIQDVLRETLDSALFLLLRQCFVEHLSRGQVASALDVLRNWVAVLNVDPSKVKSLTSALITLRNEELGDINGCDVHALRRKLLKDLENLLPPPISVPERRLEHLVESAVLSSFHRCIYHNSADPVSLYEDHHCHSDQNQIPTRTIQILTGHTHPVFLLQFSNNGEFLASTSDYDIIIWKVDEDGNFSQTDTLHHPDVVYAMAWSPDDTKLLVSGDRGLHLWELETATDKLIIGSQRFIIGDFAWLPTSRQFVWCSSARECGIFFFDLDDETKHIGQLRWFPNVERFAFTPDGARYICISSSNEILIHHIGMSADLKYIKEKPVITSLSVSEDSLLYTVNISNNEIHMWDVAGRWNKPMCFVGHMQDDTVLMSCFGGWNNRFIANGSDDSEVYIWNHNHPGDPIKVLYGHSNPVNCVSWNPIRPQMLASGSDDCTVRIWGPN